MSGETVGIAHQDLQHRDLEIHPPLSSAYRHIVGAPWRASRPTCFSLSREVLPFGFQNPGRHVSAGAGLIARDVFADFVEDGAQKRGRCRIEHETPKGKTIAAQSHGRRIQEC